MTIRDYYMNTFLNIRTTILRTAIYTIPDDPIPWKRPGGSTVRYDTQKDLKLIVGLQMRQQHSSQAIFEGPLHVDFVFHFPIPKKVKKPETWIGKFVTSTPDCSNLQKFYEDAANGILYHDDKQIVKGTFLKVYNIDVMTTIKIQELKQEQYV